MRYPFPLIGHDAARLKDNTMDDGTYDARRWEDFSAKPRLAIHPRPLLGPDTKVFAMGSCFATEIRKALVKEGYTVYPNYLGVKYNRAHQVFDKIPERDAIAHYDTFVIRQEFEAALGVWTDRAESFYEVTGAPVNKLLQKDTVYQDPTRKLVYGATLEFLKDLADKIDSKVREGIDIADVLVITLGLTEVWRLNATGRYFCRPPGTGYGGGSGDIATFRQSTFVENYENMRATLDLLFSRYPNKQIILTVSPVPLGRTYTNQDIGTANMESKSILRAVAAQICREYSSNVAYFPSYEMATIMPWPVFQEDKRHVLPEFAERVVSQFKRAFSK